MNTKKLFMLLAAVLLGSVSAFAQSGNNSPLVGDVNGDSKVDVADITAVIKIIKNTQEHYFYLGTIEPTAENYKIIPGATTSYTSFDETVGTTVSVDAGQMLYMLCPAEWVKGKTVTLEDNSGETLNFSEDIDYTTISGYAIYKTQVLNDAKDVTLKGETTYYYCGQNSGDNYITDSNYTSIATQSAFTTKAVSMTTNNYLYIVVPKTKTVEVTDPAGYGITLNYYNPSTGTYAKTANVSTGNYYLIRSRSTCAATEVWTIVLNDAKDVTLKGI